MATRETKVGTGWGGMGEAGDDLKKREEASLNFCSSHRKFVYPLFRKVHHVCIVPAVSVDP